MVSDTSTTSTAGLVRPRRRRAAAVTGLLVAVLVLVGGALFWQSQPQQSRAESTLVVLPDAGSAEAASYYDTLSTGQIATTFAEILAIRGGATDTGAEIEVEVLPGTSLIQVTAIAGDDATAEAEADAALERARPYFDQLAAPYDVFVVSPAAGTSEPTGLALPVVAGVVVAVAVIAALAAYLAVSSLQQAREHARRTVGGGAMAPSSAGRTPAPEQDLAGVAGQADRLQPDRVERTVVEVRPPQPTR